MLRSLSGALVAVLGAASLALGGCQSCAGFASDYANDVKGESTPRAAVAAWLTTPEHGYDTNLDHWGASPENPLLFRAGRSTLTVVQFTAPGSGYLVGEGSSC
jgi:hypothetical protein